MLVRHIGKYSCQVASTDNYHEGFAYFSLKSKKINIGWQMYWFVNIDE